jgi:hypothetical protein
MLFLSIGLFGLGTACATQIKIINKTKNPITVTGATVAVARGPLMQIYYIPELWNLSNKIEGVSDDKIAKHYWRDFPSHSVLSMNINGLEVNLQKFQAPDGSVGGFYPNNGFKIVVTDNGNQVTHVWGPAWGKSEVVTGHGSWD